MERKADHATANRIYDEFDPVFNWKSEQGFEILTINLPGFRKEQLKVQVTSTRKVRMDPSPQGVPYSENINVDSIAAIFLGTSLVVKLPRLEPTGKQTSPIGTTAARPPLVHKETEKVQPTKPTREEEAELEKHAEKAQLPTPSREEDKKRAEKQEALKAEENGNVCDGVKQDYRSKMNAYKENIGGYMAGMMKNNQRELTVGVVAPAAAVLLLLIGFYAGHMFTS
ncbi:hypothetical protein Bca52824_045751 [Brassica carinata]|uniref:SHSP domain-containing protein n=1 Tax=Brassica carinata TaxID=52824 RepID=A0A8X7RDS6_BRACI|nr:hypothetical protein Bca52824_045751 [Brassica carinata]